MQSLRHCDRQRASTWLLYHSLWLAQEAAQICFCAQYPEVSFFSFFRFWMSCRLVKKWSQVTFLPEPTRLRHNSCTTHWPWLVSLAVSSCRPVYTCTRHTTFCCRTSPRTLFHIFQACLVYTGWRDIDHDTSVVLIWELNSQFYGFHNLTGGRGFASQIFIELIGHRQRWQTRKPSLKINWPEACLALLVVVVERLHHRRICILAFLQMNKDSNCSSKNKFVCFVYLGLKWAFGC